MNPSLILSQNDVRNTTLDCDALGIHYQVVSEIGLLTPGKTTQVRRWDSHSKRFIPIAEWVRRAVDSDEFKFPRGDTVAVSTFMTRKMGFGNT